MPPPTRLLLPMRAVAGAGLEARPAAGAATANGPEGAATAVEVAINSNISSHSNSSSRSSRRTHRSSSSGDVCSSSISSRILGAARLDHPLNSSIGM